ncbi:unnamed protein product [Chrysoparadoxa australica]
MLDWLARFLGAGILLVLTHAVEGKARGPGIWWPNLRLWPFCQSEEDIRSYMLEVSERGFNHIYTGWTETQPPLAGDGKLQSPPGFNVNARRHQLGRGDNIYKRAVAALQSREIISSVSWAKLATLEGDWRRWGCEGPVMCTHVRCYGIFVIANPVKVAFAHWDKRMKDGGRCSSFAFSTLTGHLLAGEERFTVELAKDGSVWLDMYSVSRGAGVLGTVAFPFCRPIQKAFFTAIVRGMTQAVEREE